MRRIPRPIANSGFNSAQLEMEVRKGKVMVMVSVRQLLHGFSNYLKKIEEGERIIVLKRNVPVADIISHCENIQQPVWKRKINKMTLKGVSFSKTTVKCREEKR
ncbi:MAG: hypothetical protein HYZ66_04100 [Chlamydiae bacterium]|nr:hypothetical protein [Chlamydiota bacterium]